MLSGSRTPVLPDINDPNKLRKTLTSQSFPDNPSAEKKTHILPEHETATKPIKKSLRHNVCVSLLCDGFHRSFAELFSLLQRWDEAEEHPHKLQTLQKHLTLAETAERAGQYGEAYENLTILARSFSEPEDEWLKHHFLQMALHSARKFKMDSGRREAEANLHMGQVYLEKGQVDLAQEHYEVFYQLTLGRSWQDSSGRGLHSHSCEQLQSLYTLTGQRLLQEHEHQHAIKMFSEAYQKAKESGDRVQEAEAAHRLGLAFQSTGDQKTARKYFNTYMEISTSLGNADSMGRAYEAIAKSLESEGKLTEATEYLEKFAEISLNSKHDRNLEQAYMCLGSVLRSRQLHDRACVYFEKAYALACDRECVPLLQKAQVCVASVRALSMMTSFHTLIQTEERHNIQRILRWKERREEQDMKR